MSDFLNNDVAIDALKNAEVHVIKIGGENAVDFYSNYERIAKRAKDGVKQIIVVSAIRSSNPNDDIFRHPSVDDISADGRKKHGFNTTSHLNAIGRMLIASEDESLKDSPDFPNANTLSRSQEICRSIGDFTRQSIRRHFADTSDELHIAELEQIVGQHIDSLELNRSLYSILVSSRNQNVRNIGEDYLLTHLPTDYKRSPHRKVESITSYGEEMAKNLYAAYLSLKKLKVGVINIEDLHNIAHWDEFPIASMSGNIMDQIQGLFVKSDIIIAGGYLPILGSQRGYSDKTGALFAQAAKKLNIGQVSYFVEKAFPIMTGDPHRVSNTRVVSRMTYFLAKELFGNTHGANGAAVHPGALDMLAKDKIPVIVVNPDENDFHQSETIITDFNPVPGGIEIIAARKVPTVIEICAASMIQEDGFIRNISEFFARRKIVIDQIATSEGSISITFNSHISDEIINDLKEMIQSFSSIDYLVNIEVLRNKTLIFCLGNNMKKPGVASRATLALELVEADIHLMTQGLNECVMTFLIDDEKVDNALSLLHDFCILLPEEVSADIMREMRAKIFAAVRHVKM